MSKKKAKAAKAPVYPPISRVEVIARADEPTGHRVWDVTWERGGEKFSSLGYASAVLAWEYVHILEVQ
jgi:hypothetical protein